MKAGSSFSVIEGIGPLEAQSFGVGAVLDASPAGAPAEGTIDVAALLPDQSGPFAPSQHDESDSAAQDGDWALDRFGLCVDDHFAVLASEPGHNLSALCSAFSAGATLVVPDRAVTGDVSTLVSWLRTSNVSVLYVNPPNVRALAAQTPAPELPALKCVFISNSGDLIPHDVAALRKLSATCQCVGVYRAGLDGRPLAVYPIPDAWQLDAAPLRVPLGVELPGHTARLLRPSGLPAASGEIGEICFGSFRTGDVGRRWPDGSLEFVCRVGASPAFDPIETVATLRDMPDVSDAIVTEKVGPDGRTTLLGYAAGPSERLEAIGIHNYLRARLPSYLIPEHIVVLDELPHTALGDYDFRALPVPDAASGASQEYVAPRTPMERQLTDIIAELLDIDRVGVHDSFFELGGFSLLATRLTARIRETFSVELALRDVFEWPSVAGLATLIIQAQGELSGTDELEALLDEIERSEAGDPGPRLA